MRKIRIYSKNAFLQEEKKRRINFGYTQVLFMGSVPRINRLLTIVLLLLKVFNKKNF